MKYKASMHLKQADTEGRIPASILDEYVRQELLRQLGTAIKPQLRINRTEDNDPTKTGPFTGQANFTTELVILQADQWYQFKERLRSWCNLLFPDESQRLDVLFETLEMGNGQI